MNAAIRKELDRFNEAPFQKKDGSRHSIFLEEELPFLQPLPRYPYEFAQWKSATVQLNYHIAIDFQNYSVPYEYVRKKWMSGTPRAALRFITKGIGSAATTSLWTPRAVFHDPGAHACQPSAVQ